MVYRTFLSVLVLVLAGTQFLVQGQENLMPALQIDTLAPFKVKMRGSKPETEVGKKPMLWTTVCYQENSVGEVFFSEEKVNGKRAIGLRNLEGDPALQFYNWKPVNLAVGMRYKVSITYLSQQGAKGRLTVRFKGASPVDFPLSDTNGEWKTVENTFEGQDPGAATFFVCPITASPDAVLYVRDLALLAD